ncbi:hypothetical protein SmJEL517_g05693 [Synchytrium microbalum]|uniref:Guanine nucleotide-binding protein subunit gamma n=1 Tax=Synchytrium microbalum TaxID=1806994 RepID=A0A507BMI8_9FUNG|nr:uncharacterized protein SmJEL517_g05693 [Synchytrium microbalum]TPX30827.1 hypothetical protein SmJEL517_g05693 [Synchytrium microbalum]
MSNLTSDVEQKNHQHWKEALRANRSYMHTQFGHKGKVSIGNSQNLTSLSSSLATMSEIKLKKLVELNQRLKEQLDLNRIPVSEASSSLIKYITSTKDSLLPSVWGPVDKKDDPYAAPSGPCGDCVIF